MLKYNTFPHKVYMSVEEWTTVPPNPRQRNTERHAAKADHLLIPRDIHAVVSMAILPDGSRYKLDGHTRSFLWETGVVEPPHGLFVDVWNCNDIEEVKERYSYYDNSAAAEDSRDKMFGAFRENEVEFKSKLLSSAKVTTALRTAYEEMFGHRESKEVSEYGLVKYWLPEMRILDKCNSSHVKFPSPIFAAALITFHRYGEDALPFWNLYANNEGNKLGDQVDAVQALHDRVVSMRGDRKLTTHGNIRVMIATSLSAYNGYCKNQWYSYGLRPMSKEAYAKFIEAAKASKRAWAKEEKAK